MSDLTYWLVGMPNVGKSSLFKLLTGEQVKIANWEGVTTRCLVRETKYGQIIDTPGRRHVYIPEETWSVKPEEWLGKPDYRIIHVVDAAYLERDLMLTAQWATLGLPMGIVIHRTDLNPYLDQERIELWSKEHNIPVVCSHIRDQKWLPAFENMLGSLAQQPMRETNVEAISSAFTKNAAIQYMSQWLELAHGWSRAMQPEQSRLQVHKVSDNLDHRFLSGRFSALWAWVFLFGSLFLFLWCGQMLQLVMTFMWGWLILLIVPEIWQQHWAFNAVVGSGDVIAGLMPLVFMVYFWLSMLEQSGYGVRMGVLLSPWLRWAGLPGGAWVSMMLGLGCNVPALTAVKTISHPKHKLIAASLLPMIPCSARLMVFVVIASIAAPVYMTWIVMLMYVLSILLILLISRVLSALLAVDSPVFQVQNLVPYQKPIWRQVFSVAIRQCMSMVRRLLIYVIPLNVAIVFFDQQLIEGVSVLSMLGQAMAVLFFPIGLTVQDWPYVMSLFTGLIAKEAMLATLGSLGIVQEAMPQAMNWQGLWQQLIYVSKNLFMFSQGRLASGWSLPTTLAYLIFVSLYLPCISTYAMLKNIIGKYANRVMVMSLIIAYLAACLLYWLCQINLWFWPLVAGGVALFLISQRYKSYRRCH